MQHRFSLVWLHLVLTFHHMFLCFLNKQKTNYDMYSNDLETITLCLFWWIQVCSSIVLGDIGHALMCQCECVWWLSTFFCFVVNKYCVSAQLSHWLPLILVVCASLCGCFWFHLKPVDNSCVSDWLPNGHLVNDQRLESVWRVSLANSASLNLLPTTNGKKLVSLDTLSCC